MTPNSLDDTLLQDALGLSNAPIGTEGVAQISLTQSAETWQTILRHNWRRYGILVILCSPGVGILVSPIATKLIPKTTNSVQISDKQQSVSRIEYTLLALGMSLTDAQASLGRAMEVNRDETSATYKWVNSDGSEISAVFKNNKLISKHQSGLK